jgi:FixJ family two-component response regulator
LSPAPIIAIVDDDPGVRGSVDSFLRSAGMASVGFSGAQELLMSGQHGRLACIVTDMHMPGMTGLELQVEMARRGWTHPVIVMTAYPTDEAREMALGYGAAAFLTKPIDPESFLEAIERAVA